MSWHTVTPGSPSSASSVLPRLGLIVAGLVWLAAPGQARAESVGAYDLGNSCVTSDDCSSSHEGRRCLPEKGSCGCDSSDDCDAASQVCNLEERRCVIPECRSDKDCVSFNGGACDASTGRCGCTSHDQCATGTACRAGRCSVAECRVEGDCAGSAAGPHCDQTDFYCRCAPGNDAECASSPAGPICIYGACGCADDTQCVQGSYCRSDNRCVPACQGDADCVFGDVCVQGRCTVPVQPLPELDGGPQPDVIPSPDATSPPPTGDADGPSDRADASVNPEAPGPQIATRSSGCTVGAGGPDGGDGQATFGLVAAALIGLGLMRRTSSRRRRR